MKQNLFEFVVLWHPSEKNEKEQSKVVIDRTLRLATDEKSVALFAAKQVPSEYDNKLDELEILIRPF